MTPESQARACKAGREDRIGAPPPRSIPVAEPATGRPIAEVPSADAGTVASLAAAARLAQPGWWALGARGRVRSLRAARRELVRARREILDLLARETGKTSIDVVGELVAVCLDVGHVARWAATACRARRVSSRVGGWLTGKQRWIVPAPFGLVGVIGPWNAPLTLTLGDALYALAAGNVVIVKPSEVTPLAVRRAVAAMAEVLPVGVLQVVTGAGDTGAALVDVADLVCVTGSPATGRRVMARAAENLTPVLLELGGKDAMVVLEDAPLERAANAAVWGGFFMTGQVCMSIERVFVVDAVADEFERRVVEKTRALRVGPGDGDVDLGPLTHAPQVAIVEAHVADAVARGARVLTGGSRLDSLGERFYGPTVLAGVTPDMRVMREETFGPVLAIRRVAGVDEAVALANDSPFGLNASVWTRDVARGRQIAERLETGSACVNDCILNAGDADLPFGGAKQSGIGWRHGGVDGVRVFLRPRAIRTDRGRRARDLPWFPYRSGTARFVERAVGWIWGWGR